MKSFKDLVYDYPDILENFLFGNGFSQSFHGNFKYNSLYDNVKDSLTKEDIKLFEEVLHTTNFEMVLNSLLNTEKVVKVFKLYDPRLEKSYQNIKNQLIRSVKNIHPNYEDVSASLSKLAWSFNIFKRNIFTTNYDLLTYWGILIISESYKKGGSRCSRKVTDGFFKHSGIITFSEENFEPNGLNFHFLHGALHFYKENGDIIKTTRKGKYLLERITEQFEKGIFPLYVSEGSTEKKITQIKSNYYLNTCYKRLIEVSKGITIFGQGLFEKYDGHLINAINHAKNLEYIAYGIYPTESDTYNDIEHRIEKLFRPSGKTLLFFDSRTFFDSVKEIANAGIPSFLRTPTAFPDPENFLWSHNPEIIKKAPTD
ncbi:MULTISPECIES: DUF4917 family protein [Bacillus]|mgnify:CR=1 FL=1|uniref:DUF4917 family protein n=1 Tax=Bacillus licheniformis TaxID=1402 RepID=UPI000BE36B9A|nr:DUF4917 family protein [Bacillus licheniformis]ATI77413.1 hypothetical protein CPQ91_16920 [Bacillus licheniformis]MEC2364847.1 DUF4917 family protein [Bacillus licheniformis]MED0696392.1 DUF4917 family protein [Bacillus licheniformis]MED0795156.1 DUF4917 family protein [Bacillus licheniformis]MED0821343.1 DUF4917 family protein [Bacillus licheniformis]